MAILTYKSFVPLLDVAKKEGDATAYIQFRNSSTSHGMTDLVDSDVFAVMDDISGSPGSDGGGLQIFSYGRDILVRATRIRSHVGTPTTTKSTFASANIQIECHKKSGANSTSQADDENIVAFLSGSTTKMILTGGGDIHLDASGGAGSAGVITGTAPDEQIAGYNIFDDYPDWQVARALKASLMPEGHYLRERCAEIVEQYAPLLARAGLVTYNEDGHHFIAMKKLSLFMLDAVYQLGQKLFVEQEARIADLEARLIDERP